MFSLLQQVKNRRLLKHPQQLLQRQFLWDGNVPATLDGWRVGTIKKVDLKSDVSTPLQPRPPNTTEPITSSLSKNIPLSVALRSAADPSESQIDQDIQHLRRELRRNGDVVPKEALKIDTPLHVIASNEEADDGCKILSAEKILGFNVCPPSFSKDEHVAVRTIQLSSPSDTIVFDIASIGGLPLPLKNILEDPFRLKIGHTTISQLIRLEREFDLVPQAATDLVPLCLAMRLGASLSMMCQRVLHRTMPRAEVTSNWNTETLTPNQLLHAAAESWACMKLFTFFTSRLSSYTIERHLKLLSAPIYVPGEMKSNVAICMKPFRCENFSIDSRMDLRTLLPAADWDGGTTAANKQLSQQRHVQSSVTNLSYTHPSFQRGGGSYMASGRNSISNLDQTVSENPQTNHVSGEVELDTSNTNLIAQMKQQLNRGEQQNLKRRGTVSVAADSVFKMKRRPSKPRRVIVLEENPKEYVLKYLGPMKHSSEGLVVRIRL